MNEKLYHQAPLHMKGPKLVPLSSLKEKDEVLYNKHKEKYIGREELLDQKIPELDCTREDILYLTAVHPSEIQKALEKCGRKEPFHPEYFEIDPHDLDPNNTRIDLKGRFEEFDPNTISKYNHIPEETLDHYKEEFAKGEHPFIHYEIP